MLHHVSLEVAPETSTERSSCSSCSISRACRRPTRSRPSSLARAWAHPDSPHPHARRRRRCSAIQGSWPPSHARRTAARRRLRGRGRRRAVGGAACLRAHTRGGRLEVMAAPPPPLRGLAVCSADDGLRDGARRRDPGDARDPRRRGEHRQGRAAARRGRPERRQAGGAARGLRAAVPIGPWAAGAASFGGWDELWERLWANSVDVPGPLVDRLAEACREHDIHCAIGVNERESQRPGTLYNALLLIGPRGCSGSTAS